MATAPSRADVAKLTRGRGPTDPHRRERIVEAAMRLIARNGIEGVSHRKIAQEAGVPLSSTTYYFGSREDIVIAALEQAMFDDRKKLEGWGDQIGGADEVGAALTARIMEDASDREREQIWYRLYLWGASSQATQELSYQWTQFMTDILKRHVDAPTAEILSALYDAMLMRVLTSGGRTEQRDVSRVINSVLDARPPRD
jgi:TetR/AcrR family transcriptional regulator, regulator of biofilm formation and stress response